MPQRKDCKGGRGEQAALVLRYDAQLLRRKASGAQALRQTQESFMVNFDGFSPVSDTKQARGRLTNGLFCATISAIK